MSTKPDGPIILVDDEVELVRTTLMRMRKEFGEAYVQGTSDPREAASWIELERPAALVTDLRMPHMSGLELVSLAHARWGHVPTVLMTAVPTPQVHAGERSGTFAYLPKPFTFQRLRDEVQRLISTPASPSFSGAIAVTMLADVVQLYALSTPGGLLTVESPDGVGQLWLQRSSVVHATTEQSRGVEAVFEVLSWRSGRFHFAPGEPPEQSITAGLNELLIESYRRNDERAAGRDPNAEVDDGPSVDLDEAFAALDVATEVPGAIPHPVQDAVPPPDGLPSLQPEAPEEQVMANNVKESLTRLETIEGFIGAALVDSESGMCLGFVGGGAVLNLEVAGAANAEVVRSKRKAIKNLNLRDEIEDILISLGKQYHLIRPLKNRPTVFFYVAIDRARANLALARFNLSEVEKDIVL